MPATITFSKTFETKADAIVIPVIDQKMPKGLSLPASVTKKVKDTVADCKAGECQTFTADDKGVFLVGVAKGTSSLDIEKIGGKLFASLLGLKKIEKVSVVDVLSADDAAALANGLYLRSYDFTKYKTKDKKPGKMVVKVTVAEKAAADRAFKSMKALSDAVFVARDFVNEPPNVLYPESYTAEIKKLLKDAPVKLTVFDEKKLDKMGAGALLAVGKGSERQPRLVIMEYDGRKKKAKSEKPLALVGKGVTFDTGGYCLKPRDGIVTMKMDMGGSAAVVATMKALAETQADVHVVAAVALAENMIAGNAYRVDDVLTSLSGQTIEVINTDAEGRLCLADALTYIQDNYDPRAVIDVATLTGACMAALGLNMAGVFTPEKKLEQFFWESGKETGDDFWPLPVNDDFNKLMDSDIADMKNLSSSPFGGASTAAAFLQRFITKGRAWAHLDIAGVAWRKDTTDLCPKGGAGFGVRALYHWVTHYK